MDIDPELIFGTYSICSLSGSEPHGCSMYPYCDWGSSCQGIHSFSGYNSGDSTVEGEEKALETVVDQPLKGGESSEQAEVIEASTEKPEAEASTFKSPEKSKIEVSPAPDVSE